ncbi:thioredoxin domain-containing protein [Streptomyces sp. NPDC002537]
MSGKRDRGRQARERLEAEREADAKRVRARRQLIAGAAVVGALALAGGVGLYVNHRSDTTADAVKQPYVAPGGTTGEGALTVEYGKADAKRTLDVYLDPRCPLCAEVERGLGKTMREEADKGTFKIHYHFATFLDGVLGGQGSKRALNALGAALVEGGTQKFMDYLGVLYANQPEETGPDKFGSSKTLLDLAGKVKGLRTPAFEKQVNELTFLPWAHKVSDAFNKSGEKGTPAVKLDGKALSVLYKSSESVLPIAPELFNQEILEQAKK